MSAFRQRTRWREFKYFKQIIVLLGLVALFLVVQWVIKTFQKPGHMGVIESQTMEMTVQPPAGVMPVATETVQPQFFASTVTYTGSAVAYNDITIFPRVEGWIQSLPVYPGDRVQAGQLLAQLDTRELSSRVNEAQAGQVAAGQQYQASLYQKTAANAQADKADQAIQASKANLAYWQEEIKRARALADQDVITQEEAQKEESEFLASQSAYHQALSEFKAAKQTANASKFQSNSQQAQLRQAAAAARTQQIIRSYTHITAPLGGVVTQRMISPGTLVTPGMGILQVAQISPIRIQANVAESDLQKIKLGAPVRIWVQKSQEGKPIQAKVTAIFPRAELQTRTSIVESILPNNNEQIVPGDFVTVSIQTAVRDNALTIANDAVIERDQQQAVWLMVDGKAHLKFVTTGGSNGQRTEVIEGLNAGDTVITQGNQNLVEGALVAKAEYSPQGLQALPKIISGDRLTAENQYYLRKTVGMYMAIVALEAGKTPRIGKNRFTIDVSGAGMNMPLAGVDLDMKSFMPSMASMDVPKPQIKKIKDGQFEASAMLGMPGLWQLDVTLKDSGRRIGSFSVEIEVPES